MKIVVAHQQGICVMRYYSKKQQGTVIIEFALSLVIVIPVLIFFYSYWEALSLKRAVENCAYLSVQASSNMARPLSGANQTILTTICRHGNPDSGTPLLHPALSGVTPTFNVFTISGQDFLELNVEAPFTPTIFSEIEVQKYLPVSSLEATYVQAFN